MRGVVLPLFLLAFIAMPMPAVSDPDISAYPLLFQRNSPGTTGSEPVDIVIVGDVLFARGVDRQAASNGMDDPLSRVSPLLRSADLAVGNFEGTIAHEDVGSRREGPWRFKARPEAAAAVARAGFDLMSLANNHAMDWGPEALQATAGYLRLNRVGTVGAWLDRQGAQQPCVRVVGGVGTVWLAFNEIGHWEPSEAEGGYGWSRGRLTSSRLAGQVREARGMGDLVVVYLHWGQEYEEKPRPWQVDLARAAVDAGADLVVGHHPHVPQSVERYGKGLIVYSLGNFLFDQRKREAGLALWVRADKRGLMEVRGLTVTPYVKPLWQDAERSSEFIARLTLKKSASLK